MSNFCDVTLPNRFKEHGEELKAAIKGAKDLLDAFGNPRVTGVNPHHLDAEARIMSEHDPLFQKIIKDVDDHHKEIMLRDNIANSSAKELQDDNLNYIAHLLTPEARDALSSGKGRIRGYVLSNKHASMLARDPAFKGKTITEINQMAKDGKMPPQWAALNGKKLLIDDPHVVMAIRARRSAKVFGATTAMDEAARKFGKVIDDHRDMPEGWAYADNPYLKDQKVAFPKDIRDMIDDHWDRWFDDKTNGGMLQAYDNMTNWWKAHTLAWFPGYYMKNFVSNIMSNAQTGTANPAVYARAFRAMIGKKGQINTGFGVLKNSDLMQMAREHGVLNTGYFSQAPRTVMQEIKGGGWNLLGTNSKVMNALHTAGKNIENNSRLAKFIDELEKGNTPQGAAAAVNKSLFNYGDKSKAIEWGDRVAPFITWRIKNMELQAKMMLERPGMFKALDTFHHDVEDNTKKPDEEKYINDYLQQMYPTRYRTNADGTSDYFAMGGWVPSADLPAIINSPAGYILNDLHPVLKTAIEAATNKRIDNLQGGDLAKKGEKDILLGHVVSKQTSEALRNIRIINEASNFYDNPHVNAKTNTAPLNTQERFLNWLSGFRRYSQNLPMNHAQALEKIQADYNSNSAAIKRTMSNMGTSTEDKQRMMGAELDDMKDTTKELNDDPE